MEKYKCVEEIKNTNWPFPVLISDTMMKSRTLNLAQNMTHQYANSVLLAAILLCHILHINLGWFDDIKGMHTYEVIPLHG